MGTHDDNDLSVKQNELFVGASLKQINTTLEIIKLNTDARSE